METNLIIQSTAAIKPPLNTGKRISAETISNHSSMTVSTKEILESVRNSAIKHKDVLGEILNELKPIDFREVANLKEDQTPNQKHYRVLTVREVLKVAKSLKCNLCRNQDFFFVYNGEHWQKIDRNEIETFLGAAAQKIGVDEFTSQDYKFKGELFKQFMADAYLPTPEYDSEKVLINLLNGTFEIEGQTIRKRAFSAADFLTYQLQFEYDSKALCLKWQDFLDRVLPDADRARQKILAEYIAYIFTCLKLEKTLILFGTGANGKSVVFDVINSLLGKDNVSNYSLESLGENYFRAMIANKLLNYSSEISNRLQAEKFKQLTSGEPVEARLPYGQPMMLTKYARLAFNSNELPKDVEHSEAFFRRFLIIPFDVTIPKNERNPNLAKEIVKDELSGVFNWILDGLKRLLSKNSFSDCEAVDAMLETYRFESDSVAMFLKDENYKPSENYLQVKEVYPKYRLYCLDNGYKSLGRNNFSKRLEVNKIDVRRINIGQIAFMQQEG